MKKVDFKSLIVKENEDYFLVNKPPFLSTLDERTPFRPSLIKLAREFNPDLQICHRLDKETSGILVVAKNPDAYRHMSIQLQEREVEKIYHAVCDGRHEFENTAVDLPIATTNKGKVTINRARGKEALTFFKTDRIFKKHTLVKCLPVTGRLHQIRIHLTSLDAPIAGDSGYGGRPPLLSELKKVFNLKKGTDEKPMIQRVALHAFSIRFRMPDGSEFGAEAEYPKDFGVLVKQLEKYS